MIQKNIDYQIVTMTGDDNNLKRSDFVTKKVKTRIKTPAKISDTKEITRKKKKEDDKDKIDEVIEILKDKDDKITKAIAEMSNLMRMMIFKENKPTKENKQERKERKKDEAIKEAREDDDNERENENEDDQIMEDFQEPISTQAIDFFENEMKKKKHVKHVLSAQKNLLSMSNNYTKEMEKINRAERADCNIPKEDLKKIEETRRFDDKIIREIAEKVTEMRREIIKMETKIEKITKENQEIKKKCEENHKVNTKSTGRKMTNDQPHKTNHPEETDPTSSPTKPTEQFTTVKNKKEKRKIPPVNVTPTDPTKTIDSKTPPVSYADVVFRHSQKPPKEIITKEQIEAVPELKKEIEDDINSEREPTNFNKDEIEKIRNQI